MKYMEGVPEQENPGQLRLLHFEILMEYIDEIEVESKAEIVDISTGQGHMIKELNRNNFENLTCVDIDPPSDNVLKGVDHDYVKSNINEDGLAMLDSDRFDLVISSETIEHLHNPHDFVLELTRITRDDGVILLTTPNVESFQERLRYFLTGEFDHFPEVPADKVPTGEAHMSIIHENILKNVLHVTDYSIFRTFGDFANFNSVAFGGKRTSHALSYSKGYDIRVASDE